MPTIKALPDEVINEIDRYKQFMLEHEYTTQTTQKYASHLSQFLNWPEHGESSCLQESIRNFLKECSKRIRGSYKEFRAALYLYFKVATGNNYPKRPPKERNPEIEEIVSKFYYYSVNIKRILHNSANYEAVCVRKFLEHIPRDEPNYLKNITAHTIRDYAVNRLSHLSDSSKGHEITALRNFFKFLKFEGVPVHDSIFLLPLSPAVWKNSVFPKTMDECVFDSLYQIPNTNTPTGKRDRCIILCFTELALRCKEVAGLAVDDFNWREGYVTVKNTKNFSSRRLPVSEKLYQSLIDYLKNARPVTTNKTIFIRFKHTCGESMGTSQIRGVVRRIYAKSGMEIPSTGTHILRRTAGSKIYNSGNSLKMTADILGHESLDSSVFYIKADIASLRQVAAPWPAAVREAGVHNE